LVDRFPAFQCDNFSEPVFVEDFFHKDFPKKPARIFVGALSDPEYWAPWWIKNIMSKIRDNPRHHYLFLTKAPYYQKEFMAERDKIHFGYTVTNQSEYDVVLSRAKGIYFFSIEPMFGPIDLGPYKRTEWIIVGPETGQRGSRKGTPYLVREWIKSLIDQTRDLGISLWMKDAMKQYVDVYSLPFLREIPDNFKLEVEE